eukprot:3589980-Rhodomonas_salina.1
MGAPAGLRLSYNHTLAILLSILGKFLVSSCRPCRIPVALQWRSAIVLWGPPSWSAGVCSSVGQCLPDT